MLLEIKWIIKSTKVTQSYQQLNNLRKLHGRNSIIRLPETAEESGRTVGFDATFFPWKYTKPNGIATFLLKQCGKVLCQHQP